MESPKADTGPLRDFLLVELKHHGLKQVDLAKRMGVSASALSRWILGRAQPEIPALRTAARNMGWDFDYLLVLAGYREGDTALQDRHDDLCARLRLIEITEDRYISFETLIERYAKKDRERSHAER